MDFSSSLNINLYKNAPSHALTGVLADSQAICQLYLLCCPDRVCGRERGTGGAGHSNYMY